MPLITIKYNSTLAAAYEQLQAELDAKYHAFHPTPANTAPVSGRELTDQATYGAYANHAAGPPPGVHPEKWTV